MRTLLMALVLRFPMQADTYLKFDMAAKQDFVVFVCQAGLFDAGGVQDMCENMDDVPFVGFAYAMNRRLANQPCSCCKGQEWQRLRVMKAQLKLLKGVRP